MDQIFFNVYFNAFIKTFVERDLIYFVGVCCMFTD